MGTVLCEGCPWHLAWPCCISTIAGMVFCTEILLGWVMICVRANASMAVAAQQSQTWLSASFPSLLLSLRAELLCCLALAAASPVSGYWGRFQEKMEHPLGERCFVLQWHTLAEHKEHVKKSLGNSPKQTAVRQWHSGVI